MPRLFFMANSVNISNRHFCALRITAYWQELGRVRENACCCWCCLASNTLYKSRLIEQQTAFTQQRLYLWSRERGCSVKSYIFEKFRNELWFFSRWKAHCVYSWIIFYSKTFKKMTEIWSKCFLFLNHFLYNFKSIEDVAKGRRVCMTTRSLVMLIEHTSYIAQL